MKAVGSSMVTKGRLVLGAALLLILTTSVMTVSAAGISTTATYYSQLVAGSSPNKYCEFGDAANGAGPPSFTSASADYVNPVTSPSACGVSATGTLAGSSTYAASVGTGHVGVTGGVLSGYRLQGSMLAYVGGALAANSGSAAWSARVNVNPIGGCSGGSGCRLYVLMLTSDESGLSIWSDDGFATMCFGLPAGVNHCSTYSGGVGAWVMITLLYHRSTGHLLLFYGDRLSHDLDLGTTTAPAAGGLVMFDVYRNGQPWYNCAGGCWASGQNEVVSSVGVWEGAAADALDGPVSSGSNVTWISALYNFVPVVAQPKGTVCTPNADGTHTCTVPLSAPAAPLSGSTSKFQFGYQTLDTCVTPTSWTDFGAFVPWAICMVGNIVKSAVNVVTFIANAFLDLVLPDEGRQAAEFKAFNDDVSTRGPFGIGNSLLGGLQTAQGATTFGSASVSGNGTVTSTGGGVISNNVWSVTMPSSLGGQTVTVDLATSLAFMNSSVLGITLHGLASAGVLFAFVPLILRRFTEDLRT